MLSVHYTERLIQAARVAYADGVKYEHRTGRRSFRFGHAADILHKVINQNEVAMSQAAWDRFEGLMDGDLEDIKEAFRHLGGYAQVGLENAKHHR